MFERVSYQTFERELANCGASPLFHEEYARHEALDGWVRDTVDMRRGPLRLEGSLALDAGTTLILGDLDVAGPVDLDLGGDIGGVFIVIGNVTCQHFIGAERSLVFIDGDLTARESVLTGYEDSTTVVIGSLHSRLLIGADVWIEVGAGARVDYGCGYCLPIGCDGGKAIRPIHDEEATARMVAVAPNRDGGYMFQPMDFAERVRSGGSFWR